MKGIKMVKKAGVIVSVLAGMSLTPLYASDMSYSYVEAGYFVKHDMTDFDGSGGFQIDGSFQITDNIFAFGGYRKLDFDEEKASGYDIYNRYVIKSSEPELTRFEVGGGYIFPLHENWDLYGAASLVRTDVKNNLKSNINLSNNDENKTSLSVKAGVRGMVLSNLEVRGSLGFDNSTEAFEDASKFIGNVGTSFYFIPSASVGLDVSFGGGIRMMLGGRYSF